MPYVMAPPWARRLLHLLRGGMYTMLLLSGLGAWLLTPMTVGDRLPPLLTELWGLLAVVGSVGALYGSLTRRYRWEVTSLPLLCGAVLIYAVTVWHIVAVAPTRLAQAGSITALLLALAIRYVDLLLVSARMRREHDRELMT